MTAKVPNCPKCHVPMELVQKVPGPMGLSPLYTFRCQNCQLLFTQEKREATSLEAVISEMGRLAVQVGEQLDRFFPADWGIPSRVAFARLKREWLNRFYATAASAPV